MLLKLEHIYKDYVQDKLTVPVLKDICFQVERGEYVAIMGPSGSGKTTLMNIIGCLDVASSGVYQLNGTDLKDLTTGQWHRSETAPLDLSFRHLICCQNRQHWIM